MHGDLNGRVHRKRRLAFVCRNPGSFRALGRYDGIAVWESGTLYEIKPLVAELSTAD